MVNVISSGGAGPVSSILWELIANYEAGIVEASHVFSFAAIDFDDVSELLLVIDGAATAVFRLQMRINTLATAVYFTDGRLIAAGVETLIDLNAQTALEVVTAALILGAGGAFQGKCEIFLNKANGGTEECGVISQFFGLSTGVDSYLNGRIFGSAVPSITDIEIRTTASTWKIGTRMTLYKLKRA